MTGLSAHLQVTRERFTLDVELSVAPGEVLALLGPNGAGKSTSLRALAGLVPLDGGQIRLDDAVLDDPARDLLVRTAARRVGMVFQDYLLFPHLSALDNVAFGLRAAQVARRPARDQARTWLGRMGLAELADVRPGSLSGGQAQRVALARALATGPALLLLDEPLAALDASTRMQVRADLRRHLDDYDGCTVLVTHDPLDAMVLADRIVVVEHGRAVQRGTPAQVARAPRTDYVARLMGLNLYRGVSARGQVRLDDGGSLTVTDSPDGAAFLAFPPSAVAVHRTHPDGSARNVWPGRIRGLEQRGDVVRVEVVGAPSVLADVTAAAVAELRLDLDAPVWVSVKATEVHSYRA